MKTWIVSLGFFLHLFTGSLYAADYTYDKLHRLVEVKYNSGQIISYNYDDAGNLELVTPTKTPNPDTPILNLSASPVSGNWQVYEDIRFQATPQNYPANTTIQHYEWDFDNNGLIDRTTSTSETIYQYTTAGAYTAKVTAVDSLNHELSATQSITIQSVIIPPEKSNLSITVSQLSISEGNSLTATVAFDQAVDHARTVNLSLSNSELSVSSTSVTVPANQRLQSFTVQAVDNNIVDGNRNTTITASSSEANANALKTLEILDNDTNAQGLEITSLTINSTNVVTANTIAREIEVKVQNNTNQILYGTTVNVTSPDVLTFTDGTSCGGSGFNIGANSSKRCFISRIEIDDFVAPGAYSFSVNGSDQTGNYHFTKSQSFTVENNNIPDFSMSNRTQTAFSRDPNQDVQLEFVGLRSGKGYWQSPTLMTLYMQQEDSQDKTVLHSEFFDFRSSGSTERIIRLTFKAPLVPGDYRIWGEIKPSVDSYVSNNISLPSLMTVIDPNASLPIVDSITPLFGLLGQLSNFVVNGENLTDVVFTLADCNGITVVAGGSATEKTFSCTPSNLVGTKQGIIKDATGKALKSFVVEIQKPVATEPVILPASGVFTQPVTVELSSEIAGAGIYYTLDGSVPSISSLQYTAPFELDHSATLKAIVIANGYENSRVVEASYVVNYNKVRIYQTQAKTVDANNVQFSALISLDNSVSPSEYSFEYGLTPALGQIKTSVTPPPPLWDGTLSASETVAGLEVDKTYYYRLKVVAEGKTYLGAVHKFVVAGECSYRNWEVVTTPTNTAISALAYGEGVYVATAQDMLLVSSDGLNWQEGFSASNSAFQDVVWNGSQFLATNTLQNQVIISEDVVNWTVVETQLADRSYVLAWDGRQYVAVGANGLVATSADGESWVAQSSGTSESLVDVAWLENQFIAVGANGAIISSPDGITWTAESLVTTEAIAQVAGNANHRVVMVGLPGTTVNLFSQHGSANWVSSATSSGSRLIWDGLHYFVPGTDQALISPDGSQWNPLFKISDRKITGLFFDGEFIYAGDITGSIQRSRCGVPTIPVVNVDVSIPVTDEPDAFTATIVITGENLPENINIETQNCLISRGTQYDAVRQEWSNTCTSLVEGIYTGKVSDAATGEVLKNYEFELKYTVPVVNSVTNNPAVITVGDDVVFTVRGEHLRAQTVLSIDGFIDCSPFNSGGTPSPLGAYGEREFRCHANSAGSHQGVVHLDTDLTYSFSIDVLEDNDQDKDGIDDDSDNCPATANADQRNTDSDSQGDACDADDDNDGLTDVEEANLKTNPLNPDTDADGVNDGVDKFPLNNTESIDSDNDGTGDNADLDDDNDGMPDNWEIQYGLNPLDSSDAALDSDGDGVSNKDEYIRGTNPLIANVANNLTEIMKRAGMSKPVLQAIYGLEYIPPEATGTIYLDVQQGDFNADWIEKLTTDGITEGCSETRFCPNMLVTKEQLAKILLKAKFGKNYTPPLPSGSLFDDVPINVFSAGWIEGLVNQGITEGCDAKYFCPQEAVTVEGFETMLNRTLP